MGICPPATSRTIIVERVCCHLPQDCGLTHISSISHLFLASCLILVCNSESGCQHVFSKYCPDIPVISVIRLWPCSDTKQEK